MDELKNIKEGSVDNSTELLFCYTTPKGVFYSEKEPEIIGLDVNITNAFKPTILSDYGFEVSYLDPETKVLLMVETLLNGACIITQVNKNTLLWLNKNKTQAEKELNDIVLSNMSTRILQLEEELKTNQIVFQKEIEKLKYEHSVEVDSIIQEGKQLYDENENLKVQLEDINWNKNKRGRFN